MLIKQLEKRCFKLIAMIVAQCKDNGVSDVNMKLVEKYQLMLQKDPKSRVFAPLVEAYRKMGMLNEALEEGLRGVKAHPRFAGGRIALAQVLIERDQLEPAAQHLKKAVSLSPENNLAYSLLAETLVRLRQPKEALKTYKMVLFLNPANERALEAVKKLESLTADEFDSEVFQMMPLKSIDEIVEEGQYEALTPEQKRSEEENQREKWSDLERNLSLIDAFIVRNEFARARQVLDEAEKYHSSSAEIAKRRRILNQIHAEKLSSTETQVDDETKAVGLERSAGHPNLPESVSKQAILLKTLLARIADRSQDWHNRSHR